MILVNECTYCSETEKTRELLMVSNEAAEEFAFISTHMFTTIAQNLGVPSR